MSRRVFFRQSGWMILATLICGACMFAVHPFSKLIPDSEYGILGTMLAVLNCMVIPSLGLQMVFVHQTAAALSEEQKRKLTGTARSVLVGTFVIWALIAVGVFFFRETVVARWKLSNPMALWLTLLIGWGAIWKPVFAGTVQGQQNFLWFGWASIFEGAGRLAGVAVMVLVFKSYATGMMVGILGGTALSMAVYIWHSRQVLLGPSAPFEWRPWLAQVTPLTIGFGSFAFLMGADPLFVQAWFGKDKTPFYMAAGTLGRALVTFTGPVVWVMFPKIVRSVVTEEKTDVLWLSLATITALTSLGALSLSILAPLILRIVYNQSYLEGVPLLRWFAWSMLPLAVANVLLNNLMAKGRFHVVPWLAGVVGFYVLALLRFHETFLTVIRVVGCSNLLFLAVVLWFSWKYADTDPLLSQPAKSKA
jgi:O-antigen/teichoic acid export membrane protein